MLELKTRENANCQNAGKEGSKKENQQIPRIQIRKKARKESSKLQECTQLRRQKCRQVIGNKAGKKERRKSCKQAARNSASKKAGEHAR